MTNKINPLQVSIQHHQCPRIHLPQLNETETGRQIKLYHKMIGNFHYMP